MMVVDIEISKIYETIIWYLIWVFNLHKFCHTGARQGSGNKFFNVILLKSKFPIVRLCAAGYFAVQSDYFLGSAKKG